MARPKGLFALNPDAYASVYATAAAHEIALRVDLVAPPQTAKQLTAAPGVLTDIEVLFTGWGSPRIDTAFLSAAPKLKAIFYGAGSIAGWVTPAVWDRGIAVTSANTANARPVAEFTVATTLYSLKHGWRRSRDLHAGRPSAIIPMPGNYDSSIGLISMGAVARLVVELLRPFEMTVLTYDPFLSDTAAAQLGVTKVGLEELFAASDVVSLHAPELPSTHGLVTGALLDVMRPGSTFINTARGSIVREDELAVVMTARPDLTAVLDVTQHEPLPAESPLRGLANVVLTPHIAGSQGRECRRMGRAMVDELDRYLAGRPMLYQIRPDDLGKTAHGAPSAK